MKKRFLVFIFLLTLKGIAQQKTDQFLVDLLKTEKDSILHLVFSNPDSFRFQIIYTRIDRDKNNKASFRNYFYNVDSHRYFNPASTVKMPLAFLALEKLNGLERYKVDKFTTIYYDSAWSGQSIAYTDSTAESGKPSIAQHIRKVFLVSDNESYNRLYEFIGQQTINNRLHFKGYPETRITRRFVRMNADENRHTNPVRFVDSDEKLLYAQPMEINTDSFDFSQVNKMGRVYMDRDGNLIPQPIDFTTANNLGVADLQKQLQSVLFPESVPEKQRFRLKSADYQFLYQYMSQYPSETNYPKYDSAYYYDSYVKFYFKNGDHKIPEYIRVFNKVGWAYGCMTDVSYIVDFKNNLEYMITATIYVNKDGVMNDDKYEYETIASPWFYAIGNAIYNYELSRKRSHVPDLSRFKLSYETRKQDNRKVIREVDN